MLEGQDLGLGSVHVDAAGISGARCLEEALEAIHEFGGDYCGYSARNKFGVSKIECALASLSGYFGELLRVIQQALIP